MEQKWIVTVWGTRGAVPMALPDYQEFGGSTSCVCVDCGGELVIFDAGSGIVALGGQLARQGTGKRIHLFLSHLHLDHIMGLMSFQPFYTSGLEVHLYGERRDGLGVLDRLGKVLAPPFWPVGPEVFTARFAAHDVEPGQRVVLGEDLHVDTLRGNHPDGSLLYRLEGGGKRLVYGLDCELGGDMADRLADFARGCGLLIWDANFIPGEQKPGWGHSTWEEGAALGRRAGARTVLMTHFSHWYGDKFLREQERIAQAADHNVRFARERMELEL